MENTTGECVMRRTLFCLVMTLTGLLLLSPLSAQAEQTQTKLDSSGNLEFDVVDPATSITKKFYMNKDGPLVLPPVAPDPSTYPDCTQPGAVRLNDATKTIEGCIYAGVGGGVVKFAWTGLQQSPIQALKNAYGISGAPDYVVCKPGGLAWVFKLENMGNDVGGVAGAHMSYYFSGSSNHQTQDVYYDINGNYVGLYSPGSQFQASDCPGKLQMDGRLVN